MLYGENLVNPWLSVSCLLLPHDRIMREMHEIRICVGQASQTGLSSNPVNPSLEFQVRRRAGKSQPGNSLEYSMTTTSKDQHPLSWPPNSRQWRRFADLCLQLLAAFRS